MIDWSINNNGNYDLTGTCTPTAITNDQIAARQHLLDSITLYADKLQALASSASDKTLSTNAQSLATQVNGIAKSHGLSKADVSIGTDVEAAVVSIAEMALDQRRYKDAKKAASEMQPYLVKVTGALKAENNIYVDVAKGQQGNIEAALRHIIATVPIGDSERRFESVLYGRQLYESSDAFGTETLATPGGPPAPDASKLNAALDSIVTANEAIAKSGPGSVTAEVSDLVARAQAAQATQAAIAK
jgi:hypothetical protein